MPAREDVTLYNTALTVEQCQKRNQVLTAIRDQRAQTLSTLGAFTQAAAIIPHLQQSDDRYFIQMSIMNGLRQIERLDSLERILHPHRDRLLDVVSAEIVDALDESTENQSDETLMDIVEKQKHTEEKRA
jgi:hypothetical protein